MFNNVKYACYDVAMEINHSKTLVIVAGAAGEIGTEFCGTLVAEKIDTIAILRIRGISMDSEYLKETRGDLTDPASILEMFVGIDFEQYGRVIFLHTIGTDKYDPRGYPAIRKMKTIDPDVYDTNVNTFKYPLRFWDLLEVRNGRSEVLETG